ncbi:RalA-binding protein 1 [Eumeta japonica]|uniref:RalA-binding protein 1 n=1 Tax=Eumeta variegata TaxID=151549 RepID=A0A4C1Z4J4_EUMVA|nr:RalA-binding protein 1 [Eumeta japonica]
MDFESPDVEKDFPGLYASESGRKSNESDFSDGAEHEKPSKKDLLGRRKDKKESKKDRGYAALEGESSPEEDTDTNYGVRGAGDEVSPESGRLSRQ